MEFKNDLDLVGKIAAHSVMSGKYKDKDGNIKEILPVGPGNSLDFDQFREDIGAFGGGSGGTDTDEEHPSAGVDYYAGSLANGEITERTLEWSGTDDPAKDLTVTFIDDPGTKIFGQYDGITILGHIRKVALNKGVIGNTSEVDLNYDSENAKKDGYYTTTAPYPLYIKTEILPAGKTANVPINGIGEGLADSNEKVPELNLTFNSDKTMTINHVMGYSNDGDSSGASGFNYYFVIDKIATFSTQAAVAQLPPSVNLFDGSATDAQTAGIDQFYENVMDGLEITFGPYAENLRCLNSLIGGDYYDVRIEASVVSKVRIPKEYLFINNQFNFKNQITNIPTKVSVYKKQYNSWVGAGPRTTGPSSFYFYGLTNYIFNIKNNGLLSIDSKVNITALLESGVVADKTAGYIQLTLPIQKITTYKD